MPLSSLDNPHVYVNNNRSHKVTNCAGAEVALSPRRKIEYALRNVMFWGRDSLELAMEANSTISSMEILSFSSPYQPELSNMEFINYNDIY